MKRFLGNRGVTAATALFMLATGSTGASAQVTSAAAAQPVTTTTAYQTAVAQPSGPALTKAVLNTVTPTANGTISMPAPAQSVTISLPAPGPAPTLAQLVETQKSGQAFDEQANCLATAVYFESRGESLEGQLAVAHVVMNRAASGQYPTTWCEVVKQPWQFSFVRHGSWPAIRDIDSWRTAEAITRIAMANAYQSVPDDVLWYHANYVSPSWGRRLAEVTQIGVHIFYRA